jgi:hypothetical protein
MMSDFNRLASAWMEWTSLAGMTGMSVSTDCADCEISFLSEDQSFHLRQEGGWWVIDIVDDRGKRYNSAAKFSNIDLAQKYLIWRWASTARSARRLISLGPNFYKQGYSGEVALTPTDNEWDTKLTSPAGRAILSQPYSTIFSHLMSKSMDDIEQMVSDGITQR